MPVLNIDKLQLVFPLPHGELNALNNVSLQINAGEIVGLIGESGSGKSVTAMITMRLLPKNSYRITGGQLELMGTDILAASEQQMRQLRGKKVAIIFQEPMTALNPTRKIGRQLCELIRFHQRISINDARNQATRLLQEMQISDAQTVMNRYPFELSGGMCQRVLIAMAFSCKPHLIIADEPTTALDVTVQHHILHLLRTKARASGTAVLFITHDMAVVSQLCDRVYVMYAGHIIESGCVRAITIQPAHPYSIGLMQASPEYSQPRTLLPTLPGSLPNLAELPEGCVFRPRCRYASVQCMQQPPLLTSSISEQRQIACWHPETLHPPANK